MAKFNFDTFTNLIKIKGLKRAEEYRNSLKSYKKEEKVVENKKTWVDEKKDSNKGDIKSEKKEKDIITPKKEKDTVKTKIIEKKEEKVVEEDIEDVIEEAKEYTIEDLKEKLKNANIKFFNGAKSEKLIELCIENNLL